MSREVVTIEAEIEEYGRPEARWRTTLCSPSVCGVPKYETTFFDAKTGGEAYGRALLMLAMDVLAAAGLERLASELIDTVSEYDEDGG